MITVELSEIDLQSLEMVCRAKARVVKQDKPYWLALADRLLSAIPKKELPGLHRRQ